MLGEAPGVLDVDDDEVNGLEWTQHLKLLQQDTI